MAAFLQIGVLVAMAAVAVILVLGIITMARGKSAKMSNKLMQFRVLAQAIALLLLVILSFMAIGK
ncbi:twin transmembrane helix small protein [Thalassospira alkalitolerans]|uniref:twin transmembrane helix small protein n=1 Tax=Thalassospira alkalitolerans TaxID=1293890 RepID=UPI0030EC0B19|tara:strand:- start:72 stop:266 length:195 start_codon:yes stop_codon:yes gene_type:complete